jgi:hypothetical protein
MSWLKNLLSKWKVTATVVGGCLVVATVYGTCTYKPSLGEETPKGDDVSSQTTVNDEGTTAVSTTEATTETTTQAASENGIGDNTNAATSTNSKSNEVKTTETTNTNN